MKGVKILAEVFLNIRAECARHRMSISDLVQKAGIERKTYYNWEQRKDMPVSALLKFSEVLNVKTDVLLGLAEIKPKEENKNE